MSDGNFNTKLLSPGGFASGVRAGEARMKQRALTAFEEVLRGEDHLSDETRKTLLSAFKTRLD